MFISETTVKTHLAHIYTKLGVSDRAAAAATAYARGLLP
ncbi:LuxR C-terminal-related transcriptional regulator [Nonomuraea thailandensis]